MLCPVCSTNNGDSAITCHACGSPLGSGGQVNIALTLPAGTKLCGGTYSVGKSLGQGGFGITYLGSDIRLRRSVAIKEFFPQGSVRQGGTVQPSGGITLADF